ncbi:MAG: (d)CMP kinase [Candidatus Pacebacteria bacterium]|nr:(d)CMP kinase [Candidatus Paceibacterota bacterium]
MSKNLVVAIDGPAGSGKSTTAQLVAQKLGFVYIDTGAMYRAITHLAIRNNALGNNNKIIELAANSDIELKFKNGVTNISINGEDLTDKIRTLDVNKNVSDVSKIEEVRKILVRKQREIGSKATSVVMEGRDIATVVFPNADVKIFLTATIDERAKRRAKEYAENGTEIPVTEIKNNLKIRDQIDSSRDVSPLVKAEDAIVVDTSYVTIEEQVNIILQEVKRIAENLDIDVKIK